MSTTSSTVQELPREPRVRTSTPPAFRLLGWCVGVPVIAFLGVRAVQSWASLKPNVADLVLWLLLVAAASLMPVRVWGDLILTMDLPVLLAAGMLLRPFEVGLLAVLGTIDVRELQRRIPISRALFNRSEIAVSAMAASLVFHSLGGDVSQWPLAFPIAGVALLCDFLVNAALVAVGLRLLTGLPIREMLRKINEGFPAFIPGYLCFGLLAVILATTLAEAGNWTVLAFLVPILLGRQMFVHGQRLGDASRSLAAKYEGVTDVSERIVQERRDERLAVAAGLHDEVLPPLYQVHLMGQVIRQDLDRGRLLELDEDVPGLLTAAECAQQAVRGLIHDLRKSSLGPKGVSATLRLLIRDVESGTSVRIQSELEEVGGSPLVQLLTYQLAREAIQNAIKHSGADEIRVSLKREAKFVVLHVEDDGVGFRPESVDRETHFGLQLMRDRADAARGELCVESRVGRGTLVVAKLPLGGSPQE